MKQSGIEHILRNRFMLQFLCAPPRCKIRPLNCEPFGDFWYIQDYEERRDYVCEMLSQAGFSNFLKPEGSFFVFAELPQACPLSDVRILTPLSHMDVELMLQLTATY